MVQVLGSLPLWVGWIGPCSLHRYIVLYVFCYTWITFFEHKICYILVKISINIMKTCLLIMVVIVDMSQVQ